MTSAPAITATHLTKVYRDGWFVRKRVTALSDVSLEVPRGEIFGLLGPNGAGKTTLLKILLGIIRKTSGGATLLGMSAGSRRARAEVGFLPEHLRIPAHLTAWTALETYGHLHNLPTRVIHQRRPELIELVGLSERKRDRVKQYSKGMLQRLGLAQALLHRPQLLILDEPTDGLDPRARAEMRTVIRRLQEQGVTIFLNSHLLQEVELICDRVAILNRGQLRFCGRVEEITARLDQRQLQLAVEWRLSGDAAVLANMFPAAPPTETGLVEMRVSESFPHQAALDMRLDALRAAGISVVELIRQRASLEDAFLALIDAGTEHPGDMAPAPPSDDTKSIPTGGG